MVDQSTNINDQVKAEVVQTKGTDTAIAGQGLQVGLNTANVDPHKSVTEGVTDKGGVQDPVAALVVNDNQQPQPPQNPDAPTPPTGSLASQMPVGQITTPEAAGVALKHKVGLLHTLVNNMGHMKDLAVEDVEYLVADIKYLITLGGRV